MRVVRVRADDGVHTGLLVIEGPAWIHVIWPDWRGVRVNKVANDRRLRITELTSYPINRAKRILRRCGKKFGITKAARQALRQEETL